MLVGFSLGWALAHRERFVTVVVRVLIADVLLLSLSQLIAVSGIDRRIPPQEFLVNPDLVYSRFTEILVGAVITAIAFVLLLRRTTLRPRSDNQHVVGVLVVTYMIQQVLHLEHPELGYRIFPGLGFSATDGGILIPQYVSIVSYGGVFWTIILLLILCLCLGFGIAITRRLASVNHRQAASRLVKHGALYFSLYHVILMSFLLADHDALNGVMMLLIAAVTMPFGLVLG
jgi:hypothetical protein